MYICYAELWEWGTCKVCASFRGYYEATLYSLDVVKHDYFLLSTLRIPLTGVSCYWADHFALCCIKFKQVLFQGHQMHCF